MSVIYRYVFSNVLTLLYSLTTLLAFGVQYLRNFFKSPWTQKLRLEPPSRLTDPKYGVHKYIKVNNIKLHYVESGDPSKPLMLFLHGFPEFWYSWRHQIVEFQKDYRCVAVDMRGYGDSERPEGVDSYYIDTLIEDVRDLIRQLGAEKCILVSHDWGGLIACRFRDVHPELLHACIMMGSTSREAWFEHVWNNPAQRKMSWYVFLFRMPVLPELLFSMNDLTVFDQAMLIPGKNRTDQQDVECYKYWFGKPFALTPPINYYRANFIYDLPKKTIKSDVPHLVINGKKDLYISEEILDTMKKEYPKLETLLLENTSHFLQQEEPDKINAAMRDFLKKHNL